VGRGPAIAEIHGSYKAIVGSPVWQLVRALSTLVSPDVNTILVPGYYDDIRSPNDEESRLINAGIEPEEALAKIRAHLDIYALAN